MTFRFRHTVSVSEGVRLVKGPRVINLSDLTRAQAWSEHDQQFHAPLTLPTSGLHYTTRFDNTRAHQHRAFQLREQQKWKNKAYDLLVTLTDGQEMPVASFSPSLNAQHQLQLHTTEGTYLNDADMAVVWSELPQLMRCWLEQLAKDINGPLSDYLSLHEEAPEVQSSIPAYIPAEFADPQPQRPDPLSLPAEPEYPKPPSIRLWHRLVPGRQQQMARAHQNAIHEWQTAKLRWKSETHQAKSASDRARQRYKAYSSVWKARKLAHDAEQQVYTEQFSTLLLNDESLMTEVLIAELNQLDWPCQTHINAQFNLNTRVVWLDVDLPGLDQVSKQHAQISLQTQSVKIRDKSEEQILKEYAHHVRSSIVRLVGVVLGSLPAMDEVVVSGYTTRKDPDTGFERDDYLISVSVSREAYALLDFAHMEDHDPKTVLDHFNVKEATQSHQFSSIQPFEPIEADN